MDWTKELNYLNAEQSYWKFHDFNEKTCDKNIPRVREKVKNRPDTWRTRAVKDAMREKHLSWYRLKKGESKTKYRSSCKNLKNIIRKERKDFKKGIAAKFKKEPKLVYACVRSKLAVIDSVKMLKNDEGNLITNKVEAKLSKSNDVEELLLDFLKLLLLFHII